jgi:hypothetical protein
VCTPCPWIVRSLSIIFRWRSGNGSYPKFWHCRQTAQVCANLGSQPSSLLSAVGGRSDMYPFSISVSISRFTIKDIAEATLYAHLWVLTRQRLRRLATRMITAGSPHHPGMWVKDIIIRSGCVLSSSDDHDSIDFFWDDINLLVLHAPNLEHFQMTQEIQGSALAAISKVRPSLLRTLACSFDSRSVSALQIIDRFPLLVSLEASFTSTSKPTFAGVHPWVIPSVPAFKWEWLTDAPDDESLYFLTSCRFRARCRIVLTIPHLTQDQSRILNPFFDAHQPSTKITITTHARLSESSTIMAASNVELISGIPPASLFASPSLPEHICLRLGPQSTDHLFEVLDTFESQNGLEERIALQVVLSTPGIGQEFRWNRTHMNRNKAGIYFIARLLPYALRLYSLGVVIIDEAGEGLDTYIRGGTNPTRDIKHSRK